MHINLRRANMTDKVNGVNKAGEFLTGSLNYYTVATIVPVAQTNVKTPVADLYLYNGVWSAQVVVDGSGTSQTYSTQASYLDALYKQANLDTLINTFATRANPVALSVTATTDSNPSSTTYTGYSYSTHFGSAYSSSATVTLVKFAVERAAPWLVQGVGSTDDTNAAGYQLLDALQGIAVSDVAANVLTTDVFETSNATNRNTLAILSTSL